MKTSETECTSTPTKLISAKLDDVICAAAGECLQVEWSVKPPPIVHQVARAMGFTGALALCVIAGTMRASGRSAGRANTSDLPGTNESRLGTLARQHLGLMPIIVHRWRWSDWLHARQLRAENGRWIVWTAEELDRLRRPWG